MFNVGQERQPASLGASVFGPNEIYAKLKAFKTRLTGGNPKTKLYVHCYLID